MIKYSEELQALLKIGLQLKLEQSFVNNKMYSNISKVMHHRFDEKMDIHVGVNGNK